MSTRMLKPIKLLLSIVALAILSSCAYKYHEAPVKVSILKISPYTPYESFYNRLTKTLTKAGLKIGDQRQTTIPILEILSQKITLEDGDKDVNGKVINERMYYEVEYKLTDEMGVALISDSTIRASQVHNIDLDDEASTLTGRDMLTYELQQDVIAVMLKQVTTLSIKQ